MKKYRLLLTINKLPAGWELTLAFFLMLSIALFLGDGKQPVVELFTAISIVSIFILIPLRGFAWRKLPKTLHLLWLAVITAFIILTPFSDSVAYSVSATIRLLEAFVVFAIFYTLANEKSVKWFLYNLTSLAILALTIAFYLMILPIQALKLPQMNLLYAFYGHNHLASLLIFIIPFITERFLRKRNWLSLVLFIFVYVGLLLTFARGAFLVIFFFIMVKLLMIARSSNTSAKIYYGSILVVFFVIFSFFLTAPTWFDFDSSQIPQTRIKRLIWRTNNIWEVRSNYWHQAISSIKENPIFGSGPGTFYLKSKQHQQVPNTFSYYAHSFPLETLVELGIVGSIPFILLLTYLGKYWIREIHHQVEETDNHSYIRRALAWGALLTITYSMIEFNLNFLVIWLLFWAVCGIHFGLITKNKIDRLLTKKHSLVNFSVIVVFMFYLLSMASILVSRMNTGTGKKVAFLMAPFRLDQTTQLISSYRNQTLQLPPVYISVVAFFHREDPEILHELTNYYQQLAENNAVQKTYKTLLYIDPKNWEHHRQYLIWLKEQDFQSKFGQAIKNTSLQLLPMKFQTQVQHIDFSQPTFQNALLTNYLILNEAATPIELLQKFYYLSGLKVLSENPELTKQLWYLARDIYPNWGYYHIELAALEYHAFGDAKAAQYILTECLANRYAAYGCNLIINSIIPAVGSQKNSIQSIPRIL